MLRSKHQQAWVDDQAVQHRWYFAMQASILGIKAAGACNGRLKQCLPCPLAMPSTHTCSVTLSPHVPGLAMSLQ